MNVELRDYQSASVDFLAPRKRAFLISPAGSGKTIMAASAVARAIQPFQKVGWLCGTVEQRDQGIAALGRVEGPEGVTIDVQCAAARPDFSDCDVVVIDEAAHATAKGTWLPVIANLKPSAICWGFSATPWGEDEDRNKELREIFKEFYTVTREQVQNSGHLALARVLFHRLDSPGEFDDEIARATNIETLRRCRKFPMIAEWEHRRRAQWQCTLDTLKQNRTRNAHICYTASAAAAAGHSTLVLVQSIEHGLELSAATPGSELVYSKVAAKKRKALMDNFRSGELKILFGTQVCDEGVDFPRASVLVLAAGGRARGRVEQRTGRILRPFGDKDFGQVHDYTDEGAIFAAAQARAREKLYRDLNYTVEFTRD